MLKKRLIPKLLFKLRDSFRGPKPLLVITKEFKSMKPMGDPVSQAKIFEAQLADELVFLNIERSDESWPIFLSTISNMANSLATPLAVGGGIKNFEQVQLSADLLGERRPFLQDGMTIVVEFYEEEALNATLPQKVVCKVVETEPVVKGQTAANSFKPAILNNGVKIMVPPFIAQDEDIVIHTESMEYSERA